MLPDYEGQLKINQSCQMYDFQHTSQPLKMELVVVDNLPVELSSKSAALSMSTEKLEFIKSPDSPQITVQEISPDELVNYDEKV